MPRIIVKYYSDLLYIYDNLDIYFIELISSYIIIS
jgi:hypothetical protein